MPIVAPNVLKQLEMFRTLTYVLIGVIAILVPFVILGIKNMFKISKLKKLAKQGYVKIEILHKNGTVSEHVVKPKGQKVVIDKGAYLLADTAGMKDQGIVLQDGGQIELALDPNAYFIEPATGLKKWIFKEDDAIPIGVKPEEPLLNPRFFYHVLMQEAQAETTNIDKYFKIILIALAGIAGLIFLLGSGGHV